jgi:hypothetical protein
MSQSGRTARIAAEGAIIVVSILLAFWIDAWWSFRLARDAELTVLESLQVEAEENRVELDELIGANQSQLDRIDLFLAMTPDDLRSVHRDSVIPWVSAMVITWTYDGDDSAAGLFLASAAPVTLRARDVRVASAGWIRLLEDMEEEKETVWGLGVDLATHLAPYTTAVARDGQGRLQQVAGRLGPGLLAELRQDREFVAAVLNKTHYQNVYLIELTQASAALDSLRALLEEGAP